LTTAPLCGLEHVLSARPASPGRVARDAVAGDLERVAVAAGPPPGAALQPRPSGAPRGAAWAEGERAAWSGLAAALKSLRRGATTGTQPRTGAAAGAGPLRFSLLSPAAGAGPGGARAAVPAGFGAERADAGGEAMAEMDAVELDRALEEEL